MHNLFLDDSDGFRESFPVSSGRARIGAGTAEGTLTATELDRISPVGTAAMAVEKTTPTTAADVAVAAVGRAPAVALLAALFPTIIALIVGLAAFVGLLLNV